MRQVVPVNWLARAADVRRSSQAEARFARRSRHVLPILPWFRLLKCFCRVKLAPPGTLGDAIQTLAERATGDAQAVDGVGIWLNQIVFAQVQRVKPQVAGQLVQVNLDGAARLGCAMPALGTTRRLLGEETHTPKFLAGHLVPHALQPPGILRATEPL